MSIQFATPEQLLNTFADSHVERAEVPELVPPEPGPIETRDYGPPATAVRESNYISDENLLLWLAEKTDGKYGELRDAMDVSRGRSKLIEDLAHVKNMLDSGASREEVALELTKLIDAYRGTEFENELFEFAAPLVNDRLVFTAEDVVQAFATDGMGQFSTEHISEAIQSKIDALGRDDQLALIEIQSLTADIREAQQLASNLLSSSNQAANAIVGNIAR